MEKALQDYLKTHKIEYKEHKQFQPFNILIPNYNNCIRFLEELKVLFTGGGTAGHVAPNVAVIEELKRIAKRRDIDLDILYVGRFRGIERDLILKEGLKYKGIFSGKIRRYLNWRNFTDPILVFFGFLQSIFIVFSFKPDVVFAKGGFVTVPVGLAAWIRKISLIVHNNI